jgi:hypothetical protein
MKRVSIVLFCGAHERQFKIVDKGVVPFEQRQVDFNALVDAGVGKMARDSLSICRRGQPASELQEVVLRARVLNVRQERSAVWSELLLTTHPVVTDRSPQQERGRVERSWRAAGDTHRVDVVHGRGADQARGTVGWQFTQLLENKPIPTQKHTFLSRGSQVRALPGAPLPRRTSFCSLSVA